MPAPSASTSPPDDDVGQDRSSGTEPSRVAVSESGTEVESAATQPYVETLIDAARVIASVCLGGGRTKADGVCTDAGLIGFGDWAAQYMRAAAQEAPDLRAALQELVEIYGEEERFGVLLPADRQPECIRKAMAALASVPATEPVRQDAVSKTDEHKELP